MEYISQLMDLDGLKVEAFLSSGVRIEGVFDPAPENYNQSVKIGTWIVGLGDVIAYRVSEGE